MDELTELRIEAAKAVGYRVCVDSTLRYLAIAYGDNRCAFMSSDYRADDNHSPDEFWQVAASSLPDPLTSDTDCNALLVSTLSRGWRIQDAMIEDIEGELYYALVVLYNAIINTDINITRHNLNPAAAYREAVTKACVEAWKESEAIT